MVLFATEMISIGRLLGIAYLGMVLCAKFFVLWGDKKLSWPGSSVGIHRDIGAVVRCVLGGSSASRDVTPAYCPSVDYYCQVRVNSEMFYSFEP